MESLTSNFLHTPIEVIYWRIGLSPKGQDDNLSPIGEHCCAPDLKREMLGNTTSKAIMMVSTCFQGQLAHSAPTRCAHNPQASRHLQSGGGTRWQGHGSRDCNQRLLHMVLSQSMCHTPVLDQGEFGILESQKERISFPTSEPHTDHTLGLARLLS